MESCYGEKVYLQRDDLLKLINYKYVEHIV